MSQESLGPSLRGGWGSLLALCASACITTQEPPTTVLGQDPATTTQNEDQNQGSARGDGDSASDSSTRDEDDQGADDEGDDTSNTGDVDAGAGEEDAGAADRGEDCSAREAAAGALIADQCGSCHTPNFDSGGFGDALDTQAMVRDGFVVLGDLNGSQIYRVTRNGSMPLGGANFDSDQLATLSDWILCADPAGNGGTGAVGGGTQNGDEDDDEDDDDEDDDDDDDEDDDDDD